MKPRISLSFALFFAVASAEANPPPTRDVARAAQTRTTARRTPVRTPPRVATQPAAAPAAQPTVQSPAPSSPNGAITADQVAQRIQEFYDRTTNYQADFEQESRNRLYGNERRSGHMVFRRPGRMLWTYAAPSGDVIVSNGTRLIAYQAEERQAIEQSLSQSQMPTALAFLTGVGRLTESFTFRLLDANQFQYPTGYVLELRPTTPQPTYERIVFFVDRESYQVARTVIFDAQGNQNRFTFRNPRVNMNVPDSTFAWVPPAGTSIVRP